MSFDLITAGLGVAAIALVVALWRTTRPSLDSRRSCEYYRAMLRRNPGDPNLHFELASALLRRGSVVEAVEEFRRTVERDPKNALAHHSLGLSLLSLGNVHGALIHLERATTLSPHFAEAYASLGSVMELKGDLFAARAAHMRAAAIDPTLAIAHYNLARVLAATNEPAKAVTALGEAIRQDRMLLEEAKSCTDFDNLLNHPGFRRLVYGERVAC
jgi:Flp pilus assembly protein TadD